MDILPSKGNVMEVISQDDILQIHRAVLEVLYDPGVKIEHEEALELLAKAGAEIDHAKQIAHLPSYLVEQRLAQASHLVTICGRDPKYDLTIGTGKAFCHTGGNALRVIDFDNGELRPSTKKDLADLTRIDDALENVHLVFSDVNPQDVPQKALDQHIAQGLLSNTEKPVIAQSADAGAVKDLIRMGAAVAGSEEAFRRRPMLGTGVGFVSPLYMERNSADVLIECCRSGLPFIFVTMPSSGMTGPVTIAGNLVMVMAEVLAGVVLAQLVKPGAALVVHAMGLITDLRYGYVVRGSPEESLLTAAQNQMCRYYGLPYCHGGGFTSSVTPDMQAGYEKGITGLFNALSGGNGRVRPVLGGSREVVHYEESVIANEIFGMIYRLLRGFEVNPDTLAVQAIREVGPGGNFLTHRHTRDHYKLENPWQPKLGNRMTREEYEESGALDLLARARARVKEILDTHIPKPLDKDVQNKLQQIVDEAEGSAD